MPISYQALIVSKSPYQIIHSNNQIRYLLTPTNYQDTGPGGNPNTNEYYYGSNNVPYLGVIKNAQGQCVMQNSITSPSLWVVDLHQCTSYDCEGDSPAAKRAYVYTCGGPRDSDPKISFGAYSPIDDAYYFGNVVKAMYKNWYGITSIVTPPSHPIPLILRAHYAELDNCGQNGNHCTRMNIPNAFWDDDTKTMNFEDGVVKSTDPTLPATFPFVALELTGHEISHGFTSWNAKLDGNTQANALNEAFSDMAGVAAEAYLLQNNPALYQSIYHSQKINWQIGKTLPRYSETSSTQKAMLPYRFMNTPAKDGFSADCFKQVSGCQRTYADVTAAAKKAFSDPDEQQQYIAHFANGIFNRAFYLYVTALENQDNLSNVNAVKQAFHVFLVANQSGWQAGTPNDETYFAQAACIAYSKAKFLKVDSEALAQAFAQVGITTVVNNQCQKVSQKAL